MGSEVSKAAEHYVGEAIGGAIEGALFNAYASEREPTTPLNFRMLLLGPSGSGKSTLLKQLERTHDLRQELFEHVSASEPLLLPFGGVEPVSEEKVSDMAAIAPISPPRVTVDQIAESIRRCVVEDIHDLCLFFVTQMEGGNEEVLGIEFDDSKVLGVVKMLGASVDWSADTRLTLAVAELFAMLWTDTGFKTLFQIHSRSHVFDETHYFFDRVRQIAATDYQPSFADYLKLREPTIGVTSTALAIATPMAWMTVTDVSGLRSKHMADAFDDSCDKLVVVWVFSLCAYDQMSEENREVNAFDENWQMFSALCRRKEFDSADIVVVMNKFDVFCEKLKSVPYSVYDASVAESEAKDPTAVCRKLRVRFEKIVAERAERCHRSGHFESYQLCATDSECCRPLWRDLHECLTQYKLITEGPSVSL